MGPASNLSGHSQWTLAELTFTLPEHQHPPIPRQSCEKDVLTLGQEAQNFEQKAISQCLVLCLETLSLPVTTHKQNHTLQSIVPVPMFLNKQTKEFKISQVGKKTLVSNVCKLHPSMHIFRCLLIDLSQCLKLG